jgi:hypothetical protein
MKTAPLNQSSLNGWLLIALIITVALTAWSALDSTEENEDELLVEPVISTPNEREQNPPQVALMSQSKSLPPSALTWQIQHREQLASKPKDIFEVHAWAEPVAMKKSKLLPPPAPVAPPVPFLYMGKIEDSPQGTLLFLMGNNKMYSVALGGKVDNFWRLDTEDGQKLTLTYLPLNLSQTLSKTQKIISAGLPNAAVDAVN